jgi:hypothetical protein
MINIVAVCLARKCTALTRVATKLVIEKKFMTISFVYLLAILIEKYDKAGSLAIAVWNILHTVSP